MDGGYDRLEVSWAPAMTEPANIRSDAFAGTSEAYLRHRPPYPQELIDMLTPRSRSGRLLDLACGPGRIALRLAGAFDHVWAVDLEPEMIAAGRREAERLGLHNVEWIASPAEQLEAPERAFDLVTVGEAFHRLDQPVIARKMLAWLRPGGRVAVIGARGLLSGPEPWQRAATELVRRFTAASFPNGWAQSRTGAAATPDDQERALAEAGLVILERREFQQRRRWSFDGVLGYLESTSVSSRRVLGDRYDAFAAELRRTLAAYGDGETWTETLSFGLSLAEKPAARA
jgi:ubiquinone/menaquinone biosynthesis C-methylase UbiE